MIGGFNDAEHRFGLQQIDSPGEKRTQGKFTAAGESDAVFAEMFDRGLDDNHVRLKTCFSQGAEGHGCVLPLLQASHRVDGRPPRFGAAEDPEGGQHLAGGQLGREWLEAKGRRCGRAGDVLGREQDLPPRRASITI